MLTFKTVFDSLGAAHYFQSADDYYEKEGHNGLWAGKGADELALAGRVDKEQFQTLLNGILPDGTSTRKFRHKGKKDGKEYKERKGIDFTFSAPKSVSIQALVNGDFRLVEAHDRAVRESLAVLESHAMVKGKQNGKTYRETSGNLIFASFRHELSRAQDPQLHTHNIAMNLTKRSDGQYRSLVNDRLVRSVKQVGAFYRARLAQHVQELGYELRDGRKGIWELSHISDAAVKHFSKRSEEIEKMLKDLGMGRSREDATTAQKQMIALSSREKKTEQDREVLRALWKETAAEAGLKLTPMENLKESIKREVRTIGKSLASDKRLADQHAAAADAAVNFAIAHLAEREGIFLHSELLEKAYERGASSTTTDAIQEAVARAATDKRLHPELPLLRSARSLDEETRTLMGDPSAAHFKIDNELEQFTRESWVQISMEKRGLSRTDAEAQIDAAVKRGALVPAEPRYATPKARAEEMSILALAKEGRAAVKPLADPQVADSILSPAVLNDEQRAAGNFLLTNPDRFLALQGFAGVGKTHLFGEVANAIDALNAGRSAAEQYRVIALAPYASQVKAMEEVGWKGTTLASFLAPRRDRHHMNEHTIVILDESSVVPASSMSELMKRVERANARLVLAGDRKQTAAIEAGKPFAQLLDANIARATLTNIRRQKDPTLKRAVQLAANDQVVASIDTLKNRVVQIPPGDKRHQAIARAFVNLTPDERTKTLVVAGTNDARASINKKVRELLKLQDRVVLRTLDAIDHSRAEKALASTYHEGAIVLTGRKQRDGLQRDVPYRVIGKDTKINTVTVAGPNGETHTFDPSLDGAISVFNPLETPLAIGDRIRLTRNDKSIGAINGAIYEVADIRDDALLLRNEKGELTLPRASAMHLEHAYATTVHSAQGLTKDRVLIDADTKSLTSNRAVYYVAISRPRFDVTLYTDDKSKLAQAMNRDPKKYAALELRDVRNEAYFVGKRLESGNVRTLKPRMR
jgi:conjugative relaxase-like TrwC/TraI family protein